MKHVLLVPALVVTSLLPATLSAKAIERYASPPGPTPAVILQGVSVPAGSDMLYLSGMLATPIDPSKPPSPALTMADFGDTKTQTISALGKIEAALKSHGFKMSDVIKLTVFVAGDPAMSGKMDFKGFNEGYKTFFGTTENPNLVARSTVQVTALAGPAFLVEIEATAAKAPMETKK